MITLVLLFDAFTSFLGAFASSLPLLYANAIAQKHKTVARTDRQEGPADKLFDEMYPADIARHKPARIKIIAPINMHYPHTHTYQ